MDTCEIASAYPVERVRLVARPASTKARPKTPWRAPSFSTASARSAIAASSTSVIARADSTLSLPPSSYGIRSTSSARSRRGRRRPDHRRGPAAPSLAAGMGAHQPDWRLLLGHVTGARARSISAAPDPCTRSRRRRLACVKFRFVFSPLLPALDPRTAELASDRFGENFGYLIQGCGS